MNGFHRGLSTTLELKVSTVTVPLGVASHVPAEPDLLFNNRTGSRGLVPDTKCTLTNDGRERTTDCYQLLAYCTSLGLPRGVLIYCDTVSSGGRAVSHDQSAPRRHGAETFRVRLSGSFTDIARDLDRLAQHLRGDALLP